MGVLVKPDQVKIDAETIGGEGIYYRQPITDGVENLGEHIKTYARITLEPGTKLGYHQHVGDFEIYYILEGNGEYNDNGEIIPAGPGDVFRCEDGGWHALYNTGDTELAFMALIVNS